MNYLKYWHVLRFIAAEFFDKDAKKQGNERKNIISGISNGKTKTEYAFGYGACPKETGVIKNDCMQKLSENQKLTTSRQSVTCE